MICQAALLTRCVPTVVHAGPQYVHVCFSKVHALVQQLQLLVHGHGPRLVTLGVGTKTKEIFILQELWFLPHSQRPHVHVLDLEIFWEHVCIFCTV